MPLTIAGLIKNAVAQLQAVSDSPLLDAEVLLAEVLEKPRSYLYAWPQQQVAAADLQAFEQSLQRRSAGEPIAYITGHREFWSLDLIVSPATLIPRPDTELLVELALQHIAPATRSAIADLGTGSGAIALAIARERPQACVVASDISAAALAVARINAARLKIVNVRFVQGDWGEALHGAMFDVIVANPPYIEDNSPYLLCGDVRFEPRQALTAGADGLSALRIIIEQAAAHLQTGGWLLFEHGHEQGAAAGELLHSAGYINVSDFADMAGHSRVSIARKP
jgi:release factor glutamine methyltransferase